MIFSPLWCSTAGLPCTAVSVSTNRRSLSVSRITYLTQLLQESAIGVLRKAWREFWRVRGAGVWLLAMAVILALLILCFAIGFLKL